MSEVRYPFGDLDPDEYELKRADRVPPTELRVGENYTLMYRSMILGDQQYYSKYPVQVADFRSVEGGAEVELVHWEIRHESWLKGPKAVFVNADGLIGVEDKKPEGSELYDYGYLVEELPE